MSIESERKKLIGEDLFLTQFEKTSESIEEEIVPILSFDGIKYKIKEQEISHEFMENLEKRGVLKKVGLKSFFACPNCGSLFLILNPVCPSCKSQSLIKEDFMIHYECGYIGGIKEFFIKEDLYVCPKCKKVLTKLGRDYGRPGKLYKCVKCGAVNQTLPILFECSNGHQFRAEDADLLGYPVYKIASVKEIAILNEIIKEIKKLVADSKNSYEMKIFEKIETPNVNYIVPLYLKNKFNGKQILLDFLLDEENIENRMMNMLKLSLIPNIDLISVIKSGILDTDIFNLERITLITVQENDKDIVNRTLAALFLKIVGQSK